MTDTQISELILNFMTKEQYEALPDSTKQSLQLFFTTDDPAVYVADLLTSIANATDNTHVLGAKAVKDALESVGIKIGTTSTPDDNSTTNQIYFQILEDN